MTKTPPDCGGFISAHHGWWGGLLHLCCSAMLVSRTRLPLLLLLLSWIWTCCVCPVLLSILLLPFYLRQTGTFWPGCLQLPQKLQDSGTSAMQNSIYSQSYRRDRERGSKARQGQLWKRWFLNWEPAGEGCESSVQFWGSLEQLFGRSEGKFLLVATLFILKVQEKTTRSLVFPVHWNQ